MTSDKPPTFSLVIATVGRPSLFRALMSVRRQDWMPGDEVLLIADGPSRVARGLWNQMNLPGRYLETPRRLGYWGHGIRNWIMDTRQAHGDFIVALDDDDELAPDAILTIRELVAKNPTRPHIFRMSGAPVVGTVWKKQEVREGNVGTPMMVFPNNPGKLARFTHRYGGDFDFCRDTCAFYPEGPIWCKEVICHVRPVRSKQ